MIVVVNSADENPPQMARLRRSWPPERRWACALNEGSMLTAHRRLTRILCKSRGSLEITRLWISGAQRRAMELLKHVFPCAAFYAPKVQASANFARHSSRRHRVGRAC